MPLRKGKNHSLTAKLELRDMILNGILPAGERLYETLISERIGISRTPLREALGALENEGLRERLPTGGYSVRTFSFEDVADAIEIRGLLEGAAARKAAERGTDPVKLQEMREILTALDQVVVIGSAEFDLAAYTELNAKFHACLGELAGGQTLLRELERANRLPFASPSAFLDAQSVLQEFKQSMIVAQSQHRDLLEAIEDGEGARAEFIAREHARLALKNLKHVMKHDRSLMEKVPGLSLVAG
ncbi:MAG TPA: GntR family transcriptional regulator [Rhodobacteraceae bacterium]|nr:GntR family transcriptional regulator [Paracoccaceae bacterium]